VNGLADPQGFVQNLLLNHALAENLLVFVGHDVPVFASAFDDEAADLTQLPVDPAWTLGALDLHLRVEVPDEDLAVLTAGREHQRVQLLVDVEVDDGRPVPPEGHDVHDVGVLDHHLLGTFAIQLGREHTGPLANQEIVVLVAVFLDQGRQIEYPDDSIVVPHNQPVFRLELG